MRKILFSALLFVIVPPIALAISLETKEAYQPGETFISEISGNILDQIKKENVELKRKNVQVPFEYDVKKLGESYFIYAILPNLENNYTLIIKNITTTVDGEVRKIDFEKDIEVFGEKIPYSINPGFILTGKSSFEFTIILHQDAKETIMANYPEEEEIILSPGENSLEFTTEFLEQGINVIQIGIYTVPVFMLPTESTIGIPERTLVRSVPLEIRRTVLIGQERDFPFRILNSGEKIIEEITIEYNEEIFSLNPAEIDLLGPKEEREFVLSPKKINEDISETILIKTKDELIEVPVVITYTEEESEAFPAESQNVSEVVGYYCVSELDGEICSVDQACSGENIASLDSNNCCIGSCVKQEQEEGSGFNYIGYLLGGIAILIMLIIAVKYRRTKKQKNPLSRVLKK